jgi:putative phosphoesterase
MKIIVFSDSHGELEGMRKVIDREQPDYVFHLGDHDSDAEQISRDYPALAVAMVRGNCDGWSDTPKTLCFVLGGVRFFLCHGHTLGVKGGYLRAEYAALEQNADVLLFGHTHEAYYECMNKGTERELHVMNPGSCGYSWRPSYGRILLEPGRKPKFSLEKI